MFDDFNFETHIDPKIAKANATKQASKLVKSIAEAYSTGLFDDPKSAWSFCQLLACVCEGKVQGFYDSEEALVKWSLTDSYQDELTAAAAAMESQMFESGRIVPGPWPNPHQK